MKSSFSEFISKISFIVKSWQVPGGSGGSGGSGSAEADSAHWAHRAALAAPVREVVVVSFLQDVMRSSVVGLLIDHPAGGAEQEGGGRGGGQVQLQNQLLRLEEFTKQTWTKNILFSVVQSERNYSWLQQNHSRNTQHSWKLKTAQISKTQAKTSKAH